jgi:hypothetical protein
MRKIVEKAEGGDEARLDILVVILKLMNAAAVFASALG